MKDTSEHYDPWQCYTTCSFIMKAGDTFYQLRGFRLWEENRMRGKSSPGLNTSLPMTKSLECILVAHDVHTEDIRTRTPASP
jgi:hypothetical protein